MQKLYYIILLFWSMSWLYLLLLKLTIGAKMGNHYKQELAKDIVELA